MTSTALASVSIELMAAAHGPDGQLVHLLPAGTFGGRDGRGPYRLADPAAVIEASRQVAGRRLIPIDYDHQIDFARQNGKAAPAAGWIKALQSRPNGIWGLVEWTERAAAHLGKREYRYLSPVFQHTGDGTIARLLRAALTNNPNLDQLTALASMETTMDDPMDELRELLQLPAEADVAAVTGKVRDLLTARNSAAPDPAKFVPIGDFERAVAEVNKLNKGISLQAATDHVSAQIAAMRLPPFLKDWGISLCSVNKPEFDKFMDRTGGAFYRAIAPTHTKATPPPGDAVGALSEQEQAICATMGLSEKDYLTTRATQQEETER